MKIFFTLLVSLFAAHFASCQKAGCTRIWDISQNCCPDGYEFDQANCASPHTVPSGWSGFIFQNGLYVHAQNGNCPSGYTWNGQHCDSGIRVPNRYQAFIFQNRLYASPNCCLCPDGTIDDGANCSTQVPAPDGYHYWIQTIGGRYAFMSSPNCQISSLNNCCPEGYQFDGVNCYSYYDIPEGYQNSWFRFQGVLYLRPTCCNQILTPQQVINILDGLRGNNVQFEFCWYAACHDNGTASICMDSHCVPDQLDVSINGSLISSSGAYSSDGCFFRNCPNLVQGNGNYSTTFSWPSSSITTINIDGDPCNTGSFTVWDLGASFGNNPCNVQVSPTSESANLESNSDNCVSVYHLYNLSGQVVFSESPYSFNQKYHQDIHLMPGIYIETETCNGKLLNSRKVFFR